MNEPEQNQPINPDEGQEAAGAAPVSSSSPSDQSAQPEFGQYNQPEYGAMSNQYPANYNPYMYGAPEQPKPEDDAQQTAQRPQTNPYMQNGYPANPYDASGRAAIRPAQWLSVWTKSIRAKPVWAESIPTARHISHQPE